MNNPNRELLLAAALALRPLLDELVFVGGCATGLLTTDEGAPNIRPTLDVAVLAEITSYAHYHRFAEPLRELGFVEDMSEGAPLCRWKHGAITLDVMPLDEHVLGFGNRWYRPAMQSATRHTLAPSVDVRMVTAPYFLATKLEAFKGRGEGDYTSHDLEDLLAVVDGRDGLLEEVRADTSELRKYLAAEIGALLTEPRFMNALPGHLLPDAASQSRIPLLLRRLKELAQVAGVDSE